jgi:regulator of PEP synthase PpsR (kinase-PPPase family)
MDQGNKNSQPTVIHIVSDSVGDSAATIAVAAASQFSAGNCIIERLSNATDISQIEAFIEAHIDDDPGNGEQIIFHTIADPALRAQLETCVKNRNVAAVDLLGPAINAIAEATGLKPKGEPGLIRKTDSGYYHRIAAMEFAVSHDDGRNPEGLKDAEIVLIGVSRSSKTPLSIYLATQGYYVANVPLAIGVKVPAELYEVDPTRVFGLTTDAELLSQIRKKRLGNARKVAAAYAEPLRVMEDLEDARSLMRRLGCIVVRTDNRAIEETAQEILRYYGMSHLTLPAA